MNNVFQPCLSILPPPQRRLWPELAALAKHGFVLYGGTAVALRLGHRPSVDFDFFSSATLEPNRLRRQLVFLSNSTVLHQDSQSLSVLIAMDGGREVKLSLFGEIDFGRVGEPEWTEDHALLVASLQDLLATKLKVIFERAQAKDYRDIATILRHGESLAYGLAAGRALFGRDFQPAVCLKALSYFSGGDLDELSADDQQTLVSAIRSVGRLPEVNRVSEVLI